MALNLAGFRAEYVIGVTVIDDQHKQFFSMLDTIATKVADLYAPLEDEVERRAVLTVMEELRDYALVHFRTEEALMRDSNFPDLRPHRREHDRFIAEVLRLLGELECGTAHAPIHIRNFMHDWYRDHILAMDVQIGKHLEQNGMKKNTEG